jgi:hypothetical protein
MDIKTFIRRELEGFKERLLLAQRKPCKTGKRHSWPA